MSPEDADKRLRALLAKAILPPDPCTFDAERIEAMLDAIGGDPFSDEEVDRILKKAKGELPVGPADPVEDVSEETSAETEEELLALHRGQGEDLPSEIKEKLRRY